MIPTAPMARGYRFKFTIAGPTAATQAKELVDSLRTGKGIDATWQEVFVTLPDGPFLTGTPTNKSSSCSTDPAWKWPSHVISKSFWISLRRSYPTYPSQNSTVRPPSLRAGKIHCRTPATVRIRICFWQVEATNTKLEQNAIDK